VNQGEIANTDTNREEKIRKRSKVEQMQRNHNRLPQTGKRGDFLSFSNHKSLDIGHQPKTPYYEVVNLVLEPLLGENFRGPVTITTPKAGRRKCYLVLDRRLWASKLSV